MRYLLSPLSILSISTERGTLQNEKKKDKELTARIKKILKQRDEAIRGVDLRKSFVILRDVSFILSTDKVELAADQLVNIEYQLLQTMS